MSKRNLDQYRPCVGIVIFNTRGEVWMGKRRGEKGAHVWQFPQGGIDKGEKPRDAAIRELWEETGLKPNVLTPLGKSKGWLTYDFPAEYKSKKISKGWAGQKQKWYAYRFHGQNKDFNLKAHSPQEFSKWRWEIFANAPDFIVPFKRDVYEELQIIFTDFANPVQKPKRKHG